MSLEFAFKSAAVVALATIVAWLPMAVFLTIDMDANLAIGLAARLLVLPALGCLVIGLPMALLVFYRSRELNLTKLLVIANSAGLALLFVSFILGHIFGAFFYGLPSILAANAFAFFGWLLIIKPMNEGINA